MRLPPGLACRSRGECPARPHMAYHPNTHHPSPHPLAKLRGCTRRRSRRNHVGAGIDRDRANAVLDLLVHDHHGIETLQIGVLTKTEGDVALAQPVDLGRARSEPPASSCPCRLLFLMNWAMMLL